MQVLKRMWHKWENGRYVARARAAGNVIEVDPEDVGRVRIKVKGTGNRIRIGALRPGNGIVKLSLCANGCEVTIGAGLAVSRRLDVLMGQDHPNFGAVTGCRLSVGERTSVESAEILLFNSNATVSVGADCMIAYDVTIHHTDAHPIYDLETGALANPVGDLRVGDHVWIGARATLLKNCSVADGCIVGWGSVVTGRFEEPNVALAGNPARVVSKPGRKLDWKPGDPAYTANRRK